MTTYAFILAGGAGTRFWPASRADRPKQLLPLLGGAPLLLETARRVLPLCDGWERILVGSGRRLAAPTAALLPELPAGNLLIEPAPRNTAPCIGWAAARAARVDPESMLMVLPSDHHIADVPRFREALQLATATAATGIITTIGIRPTHPETGYGYIETAPAKGAPAPGATAVERFVEKPNRARAEEFVASGRYLWNAGMFFFRARDMMAALHTHMPSLADGVEAIAAAEGTERERETLDRIFPTLPSVSLDVGVMERERRLAVVPGDFGWSDVGSWQSAWELSSRDDLGNAAPPGTILVGSRDNQVVDLRTAVPRKRTVALVGVKDLVVVETDDALLVLTREQAQEVRRVVEALKERGDSDLT